MISMLEALSDFDQIELDNKTEKLVLNGMMVPTNLVPSSADMIVFKQGGQLVGIYEKISLIIRRTNMETIFINRENIKNLQIKTSWWRSVNLMVYILPSTTD